jgi:hypothetical protein
VVAHRAGKSRAGCLLSILLAVIVAYSGYHAFRVYYRFWRLEDEMRTQARMAPGIDDEAIRRRLLTRVDELGLPEEARQIRIRRSARPREIRIDTSYPDTLVFPFFKYPIQLNPEARQPL